MKRKYAIFKEDKQITKAHSTRDAAMVEAFESKLAYYSYPDFINDRGGLFLINKVTPLSPQHKYKLICNNFSYIPDNIKNVGRKWVCLKILYRTLSRLLEWRFKSKSLEVF